MQKNTTKKNNNNQQLKELMAFLAHRVGAKRGDHQKWKAERHFVEMLM